MKEQMKRDRLQRCYKCKRIKSYDDFYKFRIQIKIGSKICKEYERGISRIKKHNMSRTYIKHLILQGNNGINTVLQYDDIPEEFVEVKRIHLKLKRILKQQTT